MLFVSLQGVYTTAITQSQRQGEEPNRPGEAAPPAFPPPQLVHDGRRVYDADLAALQAGVRPGQSLREAAYHVPGVVQHRFDAACYRAAEEAVWRQAARFSPRVEPLHGQHLFLDLTGAAAPQFEATALLRALVPTYAAAARAGLARSRFVARLAAEASDWGEVATQAPPCSLRFVAREDEAAFLAPLPPTALWPLPEKLQHRLSRLGLTSLGQIVQAGEGQLVSRLGREGRHVYRLATGCDEQPVAALYPPRELVERRSLPEPSGDFATLRPLLAEAATALLAALHREQAGAGYAEVEVEFLVGEPVSKRRTFRQPEAESGTLTRALAGLLAAIERELPRREEVLPAGSDVRAVTARLGRLQEAEAVQLDLLAATATPAAAVTESRLRDVLESVHHHFPRQLLHRGRELKPNRREAMLRFFDPWRGAGG